MRLGFCMKKSWEIKILGLKFLRIFNGKLNFVTKAKSWSMKIIKILSYDISIRGTSFISWEQVITDTLTVRYHDYCSDA